MKKSLFSALFLAVSAFSFYQCQKDTTVQKAPEAQQVLEERGSPCPITFTTTVDASVCGTDLSNAACLSCGGFNGTGSVNVPDNGTITFNLTTIIFSVRNTSLDTGKFTLSNTNGAIQFQLDGGECKDFYMIGCDIFEL